VRAHSASEDARERAGDTRPEPGSSARAALASDASGQRGNSIVRAHSASEDARERAGDTRPEPGSSARGAPSGAGKPTEVAKIAKITNHVFLGNISEYYATLPSGQVLRVQTHPLQHFKVGDEVAVEVDATQCSVFRRDGGDATAS